MRRSVVGAARAKAVLAIAAIGLFGLTVTSPAAAQAPRVSASCSAVAAGQFRCFALKRTDLKQALTLGPAVTPSGYGPADLRSAYHLPTSTTATTVAVVDAYNDPTAESDLARYRTQYGLPPCTTANHCFRKVNQSGTTSPMPVANAGWAGEISLDLDMVSAICPTCHILLVEARDPSDNLFRAVERARLMGAKYISMSWGGSEDGSENAYDAEYFNHPGVVYTASSGDDGYPAGASYPSSSRYVVSVGGTSLRRASGTRGWTESVWHGAGSGCSHVVTKPSFQVGVTPCSHRGETDVSAVADPQTGVAVYQAGHWYVYGGTSASAPIIAAVYALAGPPGPTDRPGSYPYRHRADLNDVTSGNNGRCSPAVLCTGHAGWDGPTGLGTPRGTAAFTAVNQVTITSPGSRVGIVGTAASLQIRAADSMPGQTLTYRASGLPAGLAIDSSTALVSGTATTTHTYRVTVTATDTTKASGSVSFIWAISGGSGAFASLPSSRILDTRTGNGVPKAAIRAGHSVTVQIASRGGVPVSGASSVAIALSVVTPSANGWVTAAAYGSPASTATVINFIRGQSLTDLALVPLSAGGRITFTNHSGSTIHLAGDLTGYYLGGAPTLAGAFKSVPSRRVLDTRTATGVPKAAIKAGHTATVQIAGRAGVPASGASAVAIAVTVVAPAADGWLTAWPHDPGARTASIVSFRHRQSMTDFVVLPIGADGKISFANNSASTIQLTGDLTGYYLSGAGSPAMSGGFASLVPYRVLDTRTGKGTPKAAIRAGASVTVRIIGRGGVPGSGASAVAIAVAVVQPAATGWLGATANGSTATIVNFGRGQSLTVLALIPLGAGGEITFTNHSAATIRLAADLTGYALP